jgi:hypothetical protein
MWILVLCVLCPQQACNVSYGWPDSHSLHWGQEALQNCVEGALKGKGVLEICMVHAAVCCLRSLSMTRHL